MEMSLELVKTWLGRMNIPFNITPRNTIVILYNMENKYKFAVNIIPEGRWIQIAASMVHADEIPKKRKEEILADLLKGNWKLNDVTYSMDPNGSLFSENDVGADSNFENFASEFGAVGFGVKYFFDEIGPKYGLRTPSEKFWVGIKSSY
ncbi:MAG: hypothetical protein ACFFC6_13260 [Promethearchaeota archaeon]